MQEPPVGPGLTRGEARVHLALLARALVHRGLAMERTGVYKRYRAAPHADAPARLLAQKRESLAELGARVREASLATREA